MISDLNARKVVHTLQGRRGNCRDGREDTQDALQNPQKPQGCRGQGVSKNR